MIYLASPYHHADPDVMHLRYQQVSEVTAYILRAGQCVYSPIAHNHPIATRFVLPREWSFWERLDYGMLRHASELWILMLDGWHQSKGVQAERAIAEELGIDTIFINHEDFQWEG